ncbi:MAG: flagellar export chaperone FliS [Clostridiales bacterium]|jgi:flagellar protein FliS|nr:flagellar export chaperone FliS [Clostridiales bacterium]
MTNPYQTYKQQAVMTMTPGQMLLAVFDELIKQLSLSQIAFEKNDIPEINRSLQKSQHIINELKGTLNFEYDISNNLSDMYNYFNYAIMNANIKKDASIIADILQMVTELRDTFSEADKLTRK